MSAKPDYRTLIKESLREIDRLQARVDAMEQARREPIAVIGMSCRFPGGSESPDGFWQLLRDGRHGVREVPADRWDVDAYYDPDPDVPGKMYTRKGAFLGAVDGFDPPFFGISPREAASLDPQQRLLLEVTWEALEVAGVPPGSLYGTNTGTFIGVSNFEHATRLGNVEPAHIDAYFGTSGALSATSGRLSFAFGLAGPSIAVDTACSSSLVAVHQACQSLRAGECDMAISGGVNMIFAPQIGVTFCKARMLAPDGFCKTFDAAADGFVRGEGCGVIVLKRLSDARAAGDPILALIRGSCVNQDGASGGLTVPSGPSQEAAIRQALQRAGIEPDRVGYVEAHGTGTALGDPIEVGALGQVFGHERTGEPLYVGSVKTNIGHLEGAAGIAGVIKVILALQHREIPPHLHLKTPSPHIPWDRLPIAVPTAATPFPDRGGDRLAGVSGFGFTGTNAHVLLSQAPASARDPETQVPRRPPGAQVLPLSAKSDAALRALAVRYADALGSAVPAGADDARLSDVCFTAQTGREHHRHRLAVAAATAAEMSAVLRSFAEPGERAESTRSPGLATGAVPGSKRPRVAFLFTGQGAQHPGMGAALYAAEPVFRATLEECARVLEPYLERPLLAVMNPEDGDRALLDRTDHTQPALFAYQCALADLWRSWGITPELVAGHSIGEYAAAYCAGVFDLAAGCRLIAARGRCTHEAPGAGAMIAVAAAPERVAAALEGEDEVSIAAENSPESTVVSGAAARVDAIAARLDELGLRVTRLRVSHGFHSPLMDPVLATFEASATRERLSAPKIRFLSTVTGALADDEVASAGYWTRHIRAPVRFTAAMETLRAGDVDTCVEVGPRPTLAALGSACAPGRFTWIPCARPDEPEHAALLEALGRLYVASAPIRWDQVVTDPGRRRVRLPTYPWQRRRHWLAALDRPPHREPRGGHPLLGAVLRSPLPQTQHESRLSETSHGYLRDHRVFERAIVPTAGYLEMALCAGRAAIGADVAVERVAIEKPLPIDPDQVRIVHTIVTPGGAGEVDATVEVLSTDADDPDARWVRHVQARVRRRGAPDERWLVPADLHAIRARLSEWDAASFYQTCRDRGVDYGPAFVWIAEVWRAPGEALARVEVPAGVGGGYALHPVLLDNCMQVLAAGIPDEGTNDAYVPVGVGRFLVLGAGDRVRFAHALIDDGDQVTADVRLLDDDGEVVAVVEGSQLRRTSAAAMQAALEIERGWLYRVVWRPAGLPGEDRAAGAERTAPRLSTPDAVIDALGAALSGFDTSALVAYADQLARLDRRSATLAHQALAGLGWSPVAGDAFTVDTLAGELGVLPGYQRLLARLCEILAEEGALRASGDGWQVVSPALPAQPWSPQGLDAISAELGLLERCGARLGEVMQGRLDPLSLLMPADRDTTATVYRDSPGAAAMNALVARAVAAAIGTSPPDRPVRIIEIGAGTGGTSTHVLSALAGHSVEYVFTDISPAFVDQARGLLSEYEFVSYRTLDIERAPSTQGVRPGGFDIVIAANVLHATRDLAVTLAHVRSLLVPGGVLVALEGTGPTRWLDLTFGLTPGWWRFADTDVRPKHPLLGAADWEALLVRGGFAEAHSVAPTIGAHRAQQAILVARTGAEGAGARWLLAADDDASTAEALAAALSRRGGACSTIRHGVGFEQLGGDEYRLDPTDPDAVAALWDALDRDGRGAVERVVYLATGAGSLPPGPGEVAVAVSSRCRRALGWARTLAERPGPASLWFVTRGAQPVESAQGESALIEAPLWGLGRVIALEQPAVWGGSIDLEPGEVSSGGLAAEADRIADHIAARFDDGEDHLAYRGGQRFVARLARLPAPPARPASIRPDAVYLITGGLGYLGLELARWLTEHGARRLWLLGRTGVGEPGSARADAVEALRAMGVAVEIIAADVADPDALAEVFSRLAAPDAPPLAGVFHAAGVSNTRFEPIADISAESMAAMLRPKVAGAWNLHRATADRPDVPLVWFSSAASVWGGRGQAHYAAANQFLDSLSHYRRAAGLPTLAVNWGQLAGGGGGLVTDEFAEWLRQIGLESIEPRDGFDAMWRLLAAEVTQATVAQVDWSRFGAVYNARRQRRLLDELVAAAPRAAANPSRRDEPAAMAAAIAAAAGPKRAELLADYVRTRVAAALGMPAADLDPELGLSALGIDSLMAVELKDHARVDLGVDIPMVAFLEEADLGALAGRILAALSDDSGPSATTSSDDDAGSGDDALTPEAAGALLSGLDQMSDQRVDEVLASLLARRQSEEP